MRWREREQTEFRFVAVGGSPLLKQGGATLQRRGESRTSINRALAPAAPQETRPFFTSIQPRNNSDRNPAAKAGGE